MQDFPGSQIARIEELPVDWQNGTIAIGNFDGVHLGHQAVLAAARQQASQAGGPCLLLTFEPHPRQFFAPSVPLFRLTPPVLKASLALSCGLDGTLIVPFDKNIQLMSARDFVADILVDRLQIKNAITGYDFHFGHKRQGTPEYLKEAGEKNGFGVTIVDECDEGGEAVSSTRIRQALEEGKVSDANQLLDWSWSLTGQVVHGEKRGRTLGFPTANIVPDPGVGLRHGIYAVSFQRGSGNIHSGVASFGRRPTFDDGKPVLEVYLFDFDDDLYGETVRVIFEEFLRPELKFESAQQLIEQMRTDCQAAKAVLARRVASSESAEPEERLDHRVDRIWPGLVKQWNDEKLV